MRGDVQKIFKKTPVDKQVMMFSATLPEETKIVCKKFMRKPVEIIVKEENKEHLEKLQQFYVKLNEDEKNRKLLDIIDKVQFNQVIIFVNNIERCEALSNILNQNSNIENEANPLTIYVDKDKNIYQIDMDLSNYMKINEDYEVYKLTIEYGAFENEESSTN